MSNEVGGKNTYSQISNSSQRQFDLPKFDMDFYDQRVPQISNRSQNQINHTKVDMSNYDQRVLEKVYMNRQNSHSPIHNLGHSHERYYIIFLFKST